MAAVAQDDQRAIAVGVTVMFNGLRSRLWSLVLAAAALFYGALGALYLGVAIV